MNSKQFLHIAASSSSRLVRLAGGRVIIWSLSGLVCLCLLATNAATGQSSQTISQSQPEQINSVQIALPVPSDKPPDRIRVRITGQIRCDTNLPYTVKTLDFYDYLRHVLPNEWLYTWDRESLRAGAVAAKMYAWYWIERGGKWPDADVYDSACDQVYNPNITRASTDQALRDTWNWKLTRSGEIFQTAYLHVCHSPGCLDQVKSQQLALSGYTWDEILAYYYPESEISAILPPENGYVLRFAGLGSGLQIPLYGNDGSLGVNIGAGDFTLEWRLLAHSDKATSRETVCAANTDWRKGQALFDRSRPGSASQYGIAILGGKLVVEITGPQGIDFTLCGQTQLADGKWRHITVQRSAQNGRIWLFVDGNLDASGWGPTGDLSYSPAGEMDPPDDRILAVGALKTGSVSTTESFSGWIDEIRFSDVLRYSPAGFDPPGRDFGPNANTTALYHLDEGCGRNIQDSSGWSSQPSDGFVSDPTSRAGPAWVDPVLSTEHRLYLPQVTVSK